MRMLSHALWAVLICGLAACADSRPAEPPAPPELSIYAPEGKLPGDARPLAYDLQMQLDPREATFTGEVTITVELDADSSGFWLHGDDLRVSAVSISAADTPELQTSGTWEEVLDSGVARIGFSQNFGPGIVNVRIQYSADFDNNLAGLFRVEEQGDAYALAKSESIQARRYLPSFDEPAFKAPFDIVLTVPGDMAAISNAPVVKETPGPENTKTVQFDTTRPLPTYLLSLAVGPFDVVDAGVLPPNEIRAEAIALRGITRKGRGADISQALEVTPSLVAFFETELKQPYPYRKLDIIAAPAWPSGATELAGAITYRESRILLNDQSGPSAKREMLRIHSHEIGHMWFGNLVTPPWWDDLWLKEAFATWGTPISLASIEPDGGHDLDAVGRGLSAMRLDSLLSVRAVREPIDRNEDIRNAYDSITYSKGMAVIRMMDAYFGAETFRPALGEYIATFEDGVADSPAFFNVMARVSGEPLLTEAFRSFVEQKGVPVVEVSPVANDPEALLFRVKQSRYAPLGSKITGQPLWTIPLCIKISGRGEPACQIMATRDAVVKVMNSENAEWVMPNAGAQGYYRFNLPGEMWSALARDFDVLSVGEQLAAVDSAFAMFEAGKLAAGPLSEIIGAAARATDRRVITAPTRRLSGYVEMLDGAERANFQAYLKTIYQDRVADARRREDADAILLDGALTGFLAYSAQDTTYRAESVERARAFLGIGQDKNPQALLSDEYRDALLLLMQDGNEDDFFGLAAAIDETDDARLRLAAIPALGGARDPDLAAAARQSVLDGDFAPRESYNLISNQMSDSATREATWDWLQANFPAFIERIPRQWLGRTPRFFASFCDDTRLSELDALFERHGDLAPGYSAALSQTRETVELCSAVKAEKIGELVNVVHPVP